MKRLWPFNKPSWADNAFKYLTLSKFRPSMKEEAELIERGELLNEMVRTEGWEILEEYAANKMNTAMRAMLTCEPEEVLIHRETIKALTGLRDFVRNNIAIGRKLQHEKDLANLEEEKTFSLR